MQSPTETTYTITELAKEFDVTTRTIRFYEHKGLVLPARQGMTRVYSAGDRVRLNLVLRGKRLGFSLHEIREILDMYDSAPGEVGQLQYMLDRLAQRRDILKRQQRDIEVTLNELDQIELQCRQQLASMRRQDKQRTDLAG